MKELIMSKECSICKETKDDSEFRLRTSKKRPKPFLTSYCKPCERKKNKKYYEKNKLKLKQEARQYYYDNKEKVLEGVSKYRDANRDTIRRKGREYYRRKLKQRLYNNCKARARYKNREFNITIDDFELPSECPLLGIPLEINDDNAGSTSHSIDRIDSTKGYIKGNVWVISYRANTIKSDATLEELKTLVNNFEKHMEIKQ